MNLTLPSCRPIVAGRTGDDRHFLELLFVVVRVRVRVRLFSGNKADEDSKWDKVLALTRIWCTSKHCVGYLCQEYISSLCGHSIYRIVFV